MPAYSPGLRKELEGAITEAASIVNRHSRGVLDEFDMDELNWYMTGVKKGLWKVNP